MRKGLVFAFAAGAAIAAGFGLLVFGPASCRSDPTDESVRAALENGRSAIAAGDHRRASRIFETGIQKLEYSYYSREWIDDTGQHLFHAEYLERKGDIAGAANERQGVLNSRLEMYRSSHRCVRWRNLPWFSR